LVKIFPLKKGKIYGINFVSGDISNMGTVRISPCTILLVKYGEFPPPTFKFYKKVLLGSLWNILHYFLIALSNKGTPTINVITPKTTRIVIGHSTASIPAPTLFVKHQQHMLKAKLLK
jgi:hypothetical protein